MSPEQPPFARLVAFEHKSAHRPDDPQFDFDGYDEYGETSNWTWGVGCFLTGLGLVASWLLWRAMN